MQIHKFGGASVKDAQGVENIKRILEYVGYNNTIVVVSAMGKTTNALEQIISNYLSKNKAITENITHLKHFHFSIIEALFKDKNHKVFDKVSQWFSSLELFLQTNKSPNYSFVYDQIIVFGELISTTIVSCFLEENGIENQWIDARELIKTNNHYQDATVIWNETQTQVASRIKNNKLYVTQGFIASDDHCFSTTLGREGSDYSAAILGYCTNCEHITIWKDVPGVFNADPRYFQNPKLLEKIPYNEAIELAFYGASVIHPKTLQPLQQKQISLFVRSFTDLSQKGSVVCNTDSLTPNIPCFIVKKNQILLSLSSLDFSFIMEEHISFIFKQLHLHKLKVSVIQNTAISFSVCLEDKYHTFDKIMPILSETFRVSFEKNVDLYTIRHATESDIQTIEQNRDVLLKQQLHQTTQIIVRQ